MPETLQVGRMRAEAEFSMGGSFCAWKKELELQPCVDAINAETNITNVVIRIMRDGVKGGCKLQSPLIV
jgi:hypothetical protein